jgi:hypothetical protein
VTPPQPAPAKTFAPIPPHTGAYLQNGAPLQPGMVPDPGAVGFRGGALKVIDADHKQSPPGTDWTPGVLRVDGDNATLDHVYVHGGVDFYGHGTLTIRNSIIEGDDGSWSPVMGRSIGSRIVIEDSTLRYKEGAPPPGPIWNNGVVQGDSAWTIRRCDLSGTPTGIADGPGDSVFEQNYLHGLKLLGTYPNETHNDGIMSYGGAGVVVRDNRIDLIGPDGRAYDGAHQNAAMFLQPAIKFPSTGIVIDGNYLAGGGFALRLEAPTSGAVVTNNTFGPTTGGYGAVAVDKGVVIAQWTDNVDEHGKPLSAR